MRSGAPESIWQRFDNQAIRRHSIRRPDLRNVQHREHKKQADWVFAFELEVLYPVHVHVWFIRPIVSLSSKTGYVETKTIDKPGHNSFRVLCTMAMKFNKSDEKKRSTGLPFGSTCRTMKVSWSTCATSGVEFTLIEKYFANLTSDVTHASTFFANSCMNSSHVVLDYRTSW